MTVGELKKMLSALKDDYEIKITMMWGDDEIDINARHLSFHAEIKNEGQLQEKKEDDVTGS